MNTVRLAILLAAALVTSAPAVLVPGAAYAHGSMKPQHGGVVQMTGETLFELVSGPQSVDVYISEEDAPLPASDYTARLIVTSASGAKATTPLVAGTGNQFRSGPRAVTRRKSGGLSGREEQRREDLRDLHDLIVAGVAGSKPLLDARFRRIQLLHRFRPREHPLRPADASSRCPACG